MFSTGRHAKKRLDVVSFAIASIFSLLLAPLVVQNLDQPAEASGAEIDKSIYLDGNDTHLRTPEGILSSDSPSNLTIALWAKYLDENQSGAEILFRLGYYTLYGLFLKDGELRYQWNNGDGQSGNQGLGFIHEEGAWHHYALVYDDSSGNPKHQIYVDGVLLDTVDAPDIQLSSGTHDKSISFGGRPSGDGSLSEFEGELDEIKVFEKSLTKTELETIMHSFGDGDGIGSMGVGDPDLVAYYNFNNSTGSDVDNKGSINNLTIVGEATYRDVASENTVRGDTVITFPRTYITNVGGWTPPVDGAAWEALMVAGGGAGGTRHGGGGGAGELLYTSNITFSGVTTVQVGQGGPGRLYVDTDRQKAGAPGQSTTLQSFRVTGGGGGFSNSGDKDESGSAGGSIGGSNGGTSSPGFTLPTSTALKETGPNSETGIGNIGGEAEITNSYKGGGGGGASFAGQSATDAKGGDGGDGYAMNISGQVVCYAAGGGGGTDEGVTAGTGGSCFGAGEISGGAGGSGSTAGDASLKMAGVGLANTGSGGGGGGFGTNSSSSSDNGIPGSGGSGVVILRTAPVATVSVASSSLPNVDNSVDVSLSARTPRSGYTYQVTLEVTTGDGKLTMGSTGIGAVENDANTDYAFEFDDVTTVDTLRLIGSLDTIRSAFDDVTFNMGNSTSDNTLRIEVVEVPDVITTDSDGGTVYYNDGRFYEYVSGVDDYSTATLGNADLNSRQAAKSKFVFNQPGYLANITSEKENDFTADRIDASNVRFGAYNANKSGTWTWLDGPEAGQVFYSGSNSVDGAYVSWAPNEPNNSAEYAVTNYTGTKGLWDDFAADADGYLAEFGVNTGASAGREFVRLFQSSTQTVSIVAPAPVINTQPTDTTAVDREATFTVSASSSSGTLSYQWQESNDGSTFTNISNSSGSFGDSSGNAYRHYSGATTDTLTIQGLDFGQNGYDYRVVVTNTLAGDTATANSSAVTLTVGSAISASEDAYVRFNNSTKFGSTDPYALLIKDTSTNSYQGTSRYPYLKFDFDNSFEWPSAVLDLHIRSLNSGVVGDLSNYESKELQISVFGIDDLESTWPGEEELNWTNAPNLDDANSTDASSFPPVFENSVKVGSLVLPLIDGTTDPDTRVTFSSEALKNLLNDSSDGEVFFILRRTDSDDKANLGFSSSETTNPPILRFQSDADTYLINYDLQGVTASGFEVQEFDGTNPVTIRNGDSLLPAGGGEFVEWNTQADGDGTSFASGASYSTKATLNLFAIYRFSTSPTLSYSDTTFSPSGTVSPSVNDDGHDGTKTYSSSTTSVCTVDSSNGDVTVQSAGTCSITASYPLTSDYLATTVTANFSISKADQTALSWDGSLADNLDYGSTLSLAVTGGSGTGAVTYTPSGGGCSISGNTLIGLDASKSCSVTATKASDDSYKATSTSSRTFTINKIAQPSALSMTSSSTMTVPETLKLTAFGGDGDGAIGFGVANAGTTGCLISNGNELSATAAGTCQVVAVRGEGTNYLQNTSSIQSITVSKAAQTVSFTSSVPSNPEALDTYTPTATSTSGLAVSFSIATGSSSVCSIAGGVVTFDTGGSCVIKADQSGNSSYSASTTVTQTIVVGKTNQNINFGSLSNKTWGSSAFQVSATASSSLSVTYSADSSTTNSACTVSSSGLVTLANVGTCVVRASQAGNSTFAAANDVLRSFEVVADTPGAPFIGSVSFGERSLTASFFKPTYLGGGTLSGYQLVAYEAVETDGLVTAGSVIATNDACRPSGTSNESCTITGLTNGSDVVLRVAAINQSGVGDQSGISQKRTPASNPEAPQNLVAVQGDGVLELSWDEPVGLGGGTFVEYKLFWREAGGTYNSFTEENHSIATKSVTGYTIRDLDNGTAYDVKILVTTSVNNQELESNTAEVVQTPYTVPNAPGSVVVIEDGERVIVSWAVPDFDGGNEINGYNVKIDDALECTLVTENSCEITKPAAGSSVTISVEAENDAGSSAPTTAAFSVPGTPPGSSQPGFGGGSGGGSTPTTGQSVEPGESQIGFTPTPPSTPARETGPVGSVQGSSEEVSFGADDSNERLTASGRGWQVSVSAQSVIGDAIPVREDKSLSFPVASVAVFEASGLKPNSVLEAWLFSEQTYLGTIDVDQSGNLIGNIQLPETLLPGEHTLQLGTETSAGRLIVLTMPVVVEGKVTVGTFKGYIAIYTKDLEGQRLSARVAGRWLVQDPIDTFKDFGYSRVVRFTGAGYDILVDVYINREFYQRTTTRTR